MKDSNLNINALDDATIVKKEDKSVNSIVKIYAIYFILLISDALQDPATSGTCENLIFDILTKRGYTLY